MVHSLVHPNLNNLQLLCHFLWALFDILCTHVGLSVPWLQACRGGQNHHWSQEHLHLLVYPMKKAWELGCQFPDGQRSHVIMLNENIYPMGEVACKKLGVEACPHSTTYIICNQYNKKWGEIALLFIERARCKEEALTSELKLHTLSYSHIIFLNAIVQLWHTIPPQSIGCD